MNHTPCVSSPVRPSWRHQLVARYFRAPEHPARLRLLGWLKRVLAVHNVRAEVFPGVIMELDDSDYVDREILFNGGYELTTLRLFDRLLAEARGFTDIGAHHGQYTLRAARIMAPRGGKVFAFEPTPVNAAALLHNASLSGLTNLELYSIALSDAPNILRMVLPRLSNTGGSRLATDGADDTSGVPIHVAVRPFAEVANRLPVEAFDLIKIDIEGYEARVLASLFTASIARPRNLIIEYTPAAFDYGVPGGLPAWLSGESYEVCTVEGKPYADQQPLPDDNLWARLRT